MSSQPDTPIDVGGISDTQRTKLQELFDLFQDDIDTGLPNTIGGHLGTIQRMMDAQQKILEYRKEHGRHEEIQVLSSSTKGSSSMNLRPYQCFSYSHLSQEHLALLGAQTNGSPPVPVEDVLSQLRLKDLAMDEKFDCHWEDVGDRLYDTLVIISETTNVDWEMASRDFSTLSLSPSDSLDLLSACGPSYSQNSTRATSRVLEPHSTPARMDLKNYERLL